MKTIHLLQHVKSSWEDEALADIERPLNIRGRRTAVPMAEYLVLADCNFKQFF